MKKKFAAIYACILASFVSLCFSGCERRGAPPSPESPEAANVANQALLQPRFGWLQKIPGDADFFVGGYDLSAMATKFVESGLLKDILSMPAVVEQLKTASLPADAPSLIAEIRKQSPEAAQAQDFAAKLLGREFFLFMPAGTSGQLLKLRDLYDSIQTLQLETIVGTMTTPPTTEGAEEQLQSTLERRITEVLFGEESGLAQKIEVPSLMIGCYAPDLKLEIEKFLKDLKEGQPPAEIALGKWSPMVGGGEIDRVTITGSTVLDEQRERELKEGLRELAEMAADPELPDRVANALKQIRIEVAVGYVGDHLIAVVGPDLDRLRLASDASGSLASSDALKRIQGVVSEQTHLISYASKGMLEVFAPRVALAPVFDAVRGALTRLLPAEELDRLSGEFTKLDERAKTFLPQAASSSCSILNVGSHVHIESVGGMTAFLTGTSASRVLTGSQFPDAVLVFSNLSDSVAFDALLTWISDLAALCYGSFDQHVLPQMPAQDIQQFKMAEQIFLPKITALYQLLREFSVDLTGPDSAFVLDFSGTLPAADPVPEPFHLLSGMPRMGIVWQLKNADGLKSWADRFMKLANDIAAFAPPDGNVPLPLPQLQPVDHPAGRAYRTPLPIDLGEWNPGVTILNSGYVVAGNHSALGHSLADASAPQEAPVWELLLRLKPLSKAAETWIAFTEKNKALFFADKPEELAQFERSIPSLRHGAAMLERLDGLHFYMDVKDGAWRRVLKLGPGAVTSAAP